MYGSDVWGWRDFLYTLGVGGVTTGMILLGYGLVAFVMWIIES